MKNGFFALCISSVFLFSCSSVKKSQEALNSGDYNTSINISVDKLRNNKTRKSNQPYIYQLEEAFAKITQRDLERISFLKSDGNPANLEQIYKLYIGLRNRQELIKPLLPLRFESENKNARFDMKDYSSRIIATKEKLSKYLYANASQLLKTGRTKLDFRAVYNDLAYLEKINPGYQDVAAKMEEAHFRGMDFVKVSLFNDTQMVIPERLESSLLNFDTYEVNNLWTVYHSNPQKNVKYDYEMELLFRDINISPEQVKERQISREKQIKDGWEYLYDNQGELVKDSLGNKIKVDSFKTVRCDFYEFTQFKSVQVAGEVFFKDVKTGQLMNTYPLASEFIFEHQYADFDGDKRAFDKGWLNLINLSQVAFPSNEQMIYDAGEDLKQRIKGIIRRNNFTQ
ncbi:hypothetical protein [Ascidiimonas sp. W6]|uniref:hypothetical protein n=1 Tax=Ascidiimonas meishanensis TaxID=3128903 RepID=UPI0030EF10D2